MDLFATSLLSRWSASALFKFIHGESKSKDRQGPQANVKLVQSQALSTYRELCSKYFSPNWALPVEYCQIESYRIGAQFAQSPRFASHHDVRSFLLCPIAVILQTTQHAGHPIDMG